MQLLVNLKRYVVVGLAIGALAACAVTPSTSVVDASTEVFNRSGRFAFSVDRTDGGRDAVQGGFQWTQDKEQLQVDLNNPMGTVLARVYVKDQSAMLQYPNGQQEFAASPDELVERLLGYALPVEGMQHWLKGQVGSAPITELQLDQGQPRSFMQQGWRVRLQRYDELGPRLLQMNRHQAQYQMSVRVIVDY